MLLRRFENESGHLYFFNKNVQEKGVMESTSKNLFVQKHLYSLVEKDGIKDITLEKYYAHIEDQANQIIEKIVTAARAGKSPNLSATEKDQWDNFVYHQWGRVPDAHDSLGTLVDFEDTLKRSIKEFEAIYRPLTDKERASLEEPKTLARLRHNARVKAMASTSIKVIEALGLRGLGVAVITRPNKSFVIGSFPVVKLTNPGMTHLAHPSVELWLPIASDIAVSPAGEQGTEPVVSLTDASHIRALNEAVFRQSTVIAGRSRDLIASLTGCR